MKIDYDALRALAALPDDRLWKEIVTVASSHGIRLSDKTPPHADLERLRGIARGDEVLRTMDALRLVSEYKRKYGKENGEK